MARLRWLPVPCGTFAVAVGVGGLLGAAFGIDRLRSLLLGADALMSVATSTSLIALGAAQLFMWRARRPLAAQAARDAAIARWLAGAVLVLMLLTLAEYVFGVDIGIDRPWHEAAGVDFPGRPTPEAAGQFATGATWLLLYDARRAPWRWLATLTMAAIAMVALATLIAFLFAGTYLWDSGGVRSISLQALVAFVALVLGGAAVQPERWFLRPFLVRGAVGVASRRVLPAALAVPLAGGLAFELVTGDDRAATTVAVAIVVTCEAVLLALSGVSTGRELRALEAERDKLEAELRWLAERDALTGLLNRRGLDAAVARRAAGGVCESVVLAVIDLDGFKQLNDSAGHLRGDTLLRTIGATLERALRPGELAARIGGDEFALVLDATDAAPAAPPSAAALRVTELVALVATCDTGVPGAEVRASAGVVRGTLGSSADELIAAADVALYTAKRSGGACVHEAEGTRA